MQTTTQTSIRKESQAPAIIDHNPDSFLKRVKCKKYGGYFTLRYTSPVTGKLTVVPIKKSGRFSSKDEALAWADKYLRACIIDEIKLFERQNWRTNAKVVQRYNEYAIQRKEDQPRSAQQDLSMLVNFGIPFFVCEINQIDPNTWGDYGEELLDWLKTGAKTRKGEALAVSSVNKVINSLNHFLKWMRKKKFIEYKNFKPFEGIDQRKQSRRGSKDLVQPEVFNKVHAYLKRKNPLYADMWYVQRRLGFRVSELIGLQFEWLSDKCPEFITGEFTRVGVPVHGSVYLESQPARPYIRRIKGVIERAPLKWREAIGPDYARTIPVTDAKAWNILVTRYEKQCQVWEAQKYGPIKDSYLLFDGAQRKYYLDFIREAYETLGLESKGSHVLRHSLCTEWTKLKISAEVAELVLGHKEDAHKSYVHIVGQINSEGQNLAPVKKLKKV